MNRTELQDLADVRIAESKILLDAGSYSGAYYLAGYAVECALKACIAKLMKPDEFPDKNFAVQCYTHDLVRLIILAELKQDFDTDTNFNPMLSQNWDTVKDWTESSRYEQKTLGEARLLYYAISGARNGVLPWIKQRW